MGIEGGNLLFSWSLPHDPEQRGVSQSGFELLITTEARGWSNPIYNSGPVSSSQPSTIISPTIAPDSSYIWRVKWMATGAVSEWSDVEAFDTAAPPNWYGAQWISSRLPKSQNQFRTNFSITEPVARARLFIAGLGYYHATINGRRVGNAVLGTFTTFEKRILYDVWDVTYYLSFENAIAVTLGNGWYSQPSVNVGPISLKLALSITYTNGRTETIVSNLSSWKTHTGPIVANDIYIGETFNASMETPGWEHADYNDARWERVITPNPVPTGVLTPQIMPKVQQIEAYSPRSITNPRPGTYVFDFGQNMAGYCKLVVRGPPGTNVTLIHSEMIYENGLVQDIYGPGNPMIDTFLIRGTGDYERYETMFTYHGFQYVQVEGFPGTPSDSSLQAYFVHSALPETGQVVFSNTLLNQIQHITRYASLSNYMNIPTDCPQRERRGWLGDAQLSAETTIHNWDMAAAYTKFIQDIRDSQEFLYSRGHGAVPDCVPYYNHGGLPSDPAWGTAYTLLYNWMYHYYGDQRILSEFYNGVQQYVESLIRQSDASTGLLLTSIYGDWCSVAQYPNPNPGCQYISPIVSSFYYIHEMEVFANVSRLLNKTSEYNRYYSIAQKARSNFHSHFWSTSTQTYANGFQADLILPLYLNLVPGDVVAKVGADLINSLKNKRQYHLDTGIVGTKFLFPVLSDLLGESDLAYQISVQNTYPSYGWMVEQGATTLWESWQGSRYVDYASRNHIMFGTQSAWYYQSLAGITNTPGTNAWSDITIHPRINGVEKNLTHTTANIDTNRGRVGAAWTTQQTYCSTVPEHGTIHFQCVSGTISKIVFASFGTPNGDCNAFTINPACNAKDSMAIVSKACLGKSSCSITAEDAVFGDPCPNTFKRMSVQVAGCEFYDFSISATIPISSQANIVVPIFASSPNSVTIVESGKIVWQHGRFVPGQVSGLVSATAGTNTVTFRAGSGSYLFSLDATFLDRSNRTEHCESVAEGEVLKMRCPAGKVITRVERARFGTGMKECGATNEGCEVGSAKYIVSRECVGKESCQVRAVAENFGTEANELCAGHKQLDAVFSCN
eukprot:TRINITY_DN2217_c0_g1_i1.p1 TRINITY_DN2217_c0_g1~~TRINITY_DN2217_c0_g1_i1.p1  ORF type:complete len:1125 (-),score=235.96 TRINITY_DN2217_c0_g1_i1:25-3231(-)